MYKFKILNPEEIKPKSKLNPKARSGHRMVADESGHLYSFGGFNVQVSADDDELSREDEWKKFRPLFQELWKFDWRKNRWLKLKSRGDIPDKLVSHCMCYWNERIIVYGGTGLPYGESSSNKLTIYHIEDNYWELIEPSSEPSRSPIEMYGQACVCDEKRGELYIVGGTNGSQYSLDVHKFNLYSKKWTVLYKSTELDEDPGCRYRHEIALSDNKIYLFGGSTCHKFYSFDKLPVFDLETKDWRFVKTKPHWKKHHHPIWPAARKCHSLVVIGKDCYVCGGTTGSAVCSDLWHINLDRLQWTLLVECIPYPAYFHAATVSLEGKLTIFGGVDDISGDSRNNKLTSIWLKIPSLKNMCLAALEYYSKNKIIPPKAVQMTGVYDANEMMTLGKTDSPELTKQNGLFYKGFVEFFAGSMGGISTVLVGQPLDTVKVKMQAFPEIHASPIRCFMNTLRNDGMFRGLYAGTSPSLVANVADNAVIFCAKGYCDTFIDSMTGRTAENRTAIDHGLAGFCGGFFSSLVLCPTELIKCKLQAMSEQGKKPGSAIGLTKQIIKQDGLRGLYRGFPATLGREMPGYFAFFSVIAATKNQFKEHTRFHEDHFLVSFIAGGNGGAALWLTIFPFDLIKSRIQIQDSKMKFFPMLIKIVREEGVRNLYRGLMPTLIRTWPATAALLFTYDKVKAYL